MANILINRWPCHRYQRPRWQICCQCQRHRSFCSCMSPCCGCFWAYRTLENEEKIRLDICMLELTFKHFDNSICTEIHNFYRRRLTQLVGVVYTHPLLFFTFALSFVIYPNLSRFHSLLQLVGVVYFILVRILQSVVSFAEPLQQSLSISAMHIINL